MIAEERTMSESERERERTTGLRTSSQPLPQAWLARQATTITTTTTTIAITGGGGGGGGCQLMVSEMDETINPLACTTNGCSDGKSSATKQTQATKITHNAQQQKNNTNTKLRR
jgi:hypothetical protein